MDSVPDPTLADALQAAVKAIGGDTRAGQVAMAEAVARAMVSAEEANKAGTDTGKSLAYLVPAVLHSVRTGDHVDVATATIALQRQLVERDLPLVADALKPLTHRPPTFAILKG